MFVLHKVQSKIPTVFQAIFQTTFKSHNIKYSHGNDKLFFLMGLGLYLRHILYNANCTDVFA